jgi:hypothetical protein
MTPETKKALIIGVAVIGGAGLFAWIYSKRDVSDAANAAAQSQAQQDQESLYELEAVQGQDGGVSLESVGATTPTSGNTTLGGELQSIYSALGITNPAAPAAPAAVATPAPASPPTVGGATTSPVGPVLSTAGPSEGASLPITVKEYYPLLN